MARFERFAASPGVARAFFWLVSELEVREILPAVRVLTLVLHRVGDRDIRVEQGRYLAEQIAGARFVELPGEDHPLRRRRTTAAPRGRASRRPSGAC